MTERNITYALTAFLYGYLTDNLGPFGVLAGLDGGTLLVGAVVAALMVAYVCYLVGGFFASCRAVDWERRDGSVGGDRPGGPGPSSVTKRL